MYRPDGTSGPTPLTGKARGSRGGMKNWVPSMVTPGRFCGVTRVKSCWTEVGTASTGSHGAGTVSYASFYRLQELDSRGAGRLTWFSWVVTSSRSSLSPAFSHSGSTRHSSVLYPIPRSGRAEANGPDQGCGGTIQHRQDKPSQ